MSKILNEWVRLEMREGVFKDKSPRSGRTVFFLCMFVLLFLWSVPVSTTVHVDNHAVVENMTHSEKVSVLISGVVDN